jgi:hypothetical protein
MSPNVFSVAITSKSAGRRISCMAQASRQHILIPPWAIAATSCATSRHNRDEASTLALSTEVTFLRRPCATKRHPHQALNFGLSIVQRIHGSPAILVVAAALRLAEVKPPGQFAKDNQIHPGHEFWLEGAGVC